MQACVGSHKGLAALCVVWVRVHVSVCVYARTPMVAIVFSMGCRLIRQRRKVPRHFGVEEGRTLLPRTVWSSPQFMPQHIVVCLARCRVCLRFSTFALCWCILYRAEPHLLPACSSPPARIQHRQVGAHRLWPCAQVPQRRWQPHGAAP